MIVLKKPIVTEKTVKSAEKSVYVFEVNFQAEKPLIKKAVESAFDVKVASVNTMIARGKGKLNKKGQRSAAPKWKKAVVTLTAGQKIAALEGV